MPLGGVGGGWWPLLAGSTSTQSRMVQNVAVAQIQKKL